MWLRNSCLFGTKKTLKQVAAIVKLDKRGTRGLHVRTAVKVDLAKRSQVNQEPKALACYGKGGN